MQERSTRSIQDLCVTPLLTPEEERLLLRHAQQGDQQSRDRLILANIRLVVKIASRYACRQLPLEDCIGEGVLGLHRAIERFDLEKPFRFTTYAYWWIRQAIQYALNVTFRSIPIPSHVVTEVHKISTACSELEGILEREPTSSEISEYAGIPIARVDRLINICKEPLSLDTPVREGGSTLGDGYLAAEPIEDHTLYRLHEFVNRVLNGLDESQRQIIIYRYGLDGLGTRTYREIAQIMDLKQTNIKKLEQQAHNILRGSFSNCVDDL